MLGTTGPLINPFPQDTPMIPMEQGHLTSSMIPSLDEPRMPDSSTPGSTMKIRKLSPAHRQLPPHITWRPCHQWAEMGGAAPVECKHDRDPDEHTTRNSTWEPEPGDTPRLLAPRLINHGKTQLGGGAPDLSKVSLFVFLCLYFSLLVCCNLLSCN
jgi:hypothetical protein